MQKQTFKKNNNIKTENTLYLRVFYTQIPFIHNPFAFVFFTVFFILFYFNFFRIYTTHI